MDIWTLISLGCGIYLIWFYRRRRRLIKEAEESLKEIEKNYDNAIKQWQESFQSSPSIKDKEKDEQEQRQLELEKQRVALGLAKDAPKNSEIPIEKICTWEDGKDGERILRYTPPIHICPCVRHYTNKTYNSLTLDFTGIGRCRYEFAPGLVRFNSSYIIMPNEIIAHSYGLKKYDEELRMKQEREQKELEERRRKAQEAEKVAIANKLKEKQRKRELVKAVTQELIDNGELFGDQPKRPPIPREVVDAVYKRDGGRCVYCGSTENIQLDHIIPFSKGGATTIENLQLLCQKCNLEKSNHIG